MERLSVAPLERSHHEGVSLQCIEPPVVVRVPLFHRAMEGVRLLRSHSVSEKLDENRIFDK